VPGGSLGFSVIVFLAVAFIGIAILLIRRKFVGGELGGSATGRLISSIGLVGLWFLYLLMCILQTFKIGTLGDYSYGIENTKNPNPTCS